MRLSAAAIALSIGVVCWSTGCTSRPENEGDLLVGAAISLQPVLDEVVLSADMHSQGAGTVVVSYAGSGTLLHQIRFGAPLDVFLSASPEHIDSLGSAGLIIPDSRTPLASNSLVLIMPIRRAPIEGVANLALSGITRIAIGEPDIVPAGRYAYQSLRQAGILERVREKLIYTKDVQQVLVYVRSGNVDAGFVYASDLLSSAPVRTIAVVPDSMHAPIIYEGVIIGSSGRSNRARRFLEYLVSDSGRSVFRRHGFLGPPA